MRNFKNFIKIVLSELSLNLAMTLVPNFYLTRLVGTIYPSEGLNKRLIQCHMVSPQLISVCNLFAPRTPNCDFRNAKNNLMFPKLRADYLKRRFSYSGAILWNNLPEEIRTSNSLGFFKRSSNRWFSDQYSHTANM